MEQLKFYKYTTLFLLLLNVAMVVFFVTRSQAPHDAKLQFMRDGVKMLQLDKEQTEAYKEMTVTHAGQLRGIIAQQKKITLPYFNTLIDSTQIYSLEEKIDSVNTLEKEKITITYQHFEDIRSLLRKEQMPGFEKFVKKAIDVVLLRKEKRKDKEKK